MKMKPRIILSAFAAILSTMLVSGGTPDSAFSEQQIFHDNGNGTITDTKTGLIWQQQPPVQKYNWHNAGKWAENLRLAGYADWRLPTIDELAALIKGRVPIGDKGYAIAPHIWLNAQGFKGMRDGTYWSSSVYAGDSPYAWYININSGLLRGQAHPYYVIAVRCGAKQ